MDTTTVGLLDGSQCWSFLGSRLRARSLLFLLLLTLSERRASFSHHALGVVLRGTNYELLQPHQCYRSSTLLLHRRAPKATKQNQSRSCSTASSSRGAPPRDSSAPHSRGHHTDTRRSTLATKEVCVRFGCPLLLLGVVSRESRPDGCCGQAFHLLWVHNHQEASQNHGDDASARLRSSRPASVVVRNVVEEEYCWWSPRTRLSAARSNQHNWHQHQASSSSSSSATKTTINHIRSTPTNSGASHDRTPKWRRTSVRAWRK